METLLRNARTGASEPGPRRMTGERVYRALLLLYPRAFRREYRDPMVQLYRDARRDRAASWTELAGDVVIVALPSSTRRRSAP